MLSEEIQDPKYWGASPIVYCWEVGYWCKCVRIYLVVSEVIVQGVLQFAKGLLFFLFLPFLTFLEDTQRG